MLGILYEPVYLVLEVGIRFPQSVDEENYGWREKGANPRWNGKIIPLGQRYPMVMEHKSQMGATCMILNFPVAMFS